MANSFVVHSFLKSDPKLIPSLPGEVQLFEVIKRNLNLVKKYEDKLLQEKARSLVPWQELTIKSIEKLLVLKNESRDAKVDSRDLLLLEILNWFKNDFFKWFDARNCTKCNIKMFSFNSRGPNVDERSIGVSRIELFRCSQCNDTFEFPRHNDPGILLDTRTGRCGEWANCFTLICRSLGFETRYVYDWTDHVWTEVYSQSQNRWLHCDPCENLCDSPLVYEVGWGKKLTFCIAFSIHEVQDVTWRYSQDHSSLKQRRAHICREQWVNDLLLKVSKNLQLSLFEDQIQELQKRRLRELVEFIRMPNQKSLLKEEEQQGRNSGSIMWRLSRGETGKSISSNGHQFLIENDFSLAYNSVSDEYKNDNKIIKNWKTLTFKYGNIDRKVERDWNMTYLARCEGSSVDGIGTIIWKLNFAKCPRWKMIIRLNCTTYENGDIQMKLYSNEKAEILLKPNQENVIQYTEIQLENDELFVEATLKGGSGLNGWQHAQLFRQSIEHEPNSCGLEIQIINN